MNPESVGFSVVALLASGIKLASEAAGHHKIHHPAPDAAAEAVTKKHEGICW
jgi:hypothetical protein